MTSVQVSSAGTFKDPDVKPLLDQYRQVVAQRYTPCAPSDLNRLLAAPPFHVSRKIDGELWFLVVSESVQLVAANGRIVVGEHAILGAAQGLPSGTVLAGELHVRKDGIRERVGDVRVALTQSPQDLVLSVFDVVQAGDVTWRDSAYVTRLTVMQELLPIDGPLAMIPVISTESEADVTGIYQDTVDKAGAEGVIVRCSDGRALKVKPERTVDCAILGFTSRVNATGEQEVRSLLLGLVTPETDDYLAIGTVGNFAEGLDRTALLRTLEPHVRPSQFRQAASTGQLYSMVEPTAIMECRVLDVQAEDAKGRPIRRPQLQFADGEWTVVGNVGAATLINPIALHLRDDKPNLVEGARWEQIADVVAGPSASGVAQQSSEIVQRRVWTKTGKDKTDVRKLVIWKTNKDDADPLYPAYVVHWTDYSAGRKSPLNREVRPAPSLEKAETIANALIEANIKKGWNEREGSA
jgi:hypothetical protein